MKNELPQNILDQIESHTSEETFFLDSNRKIVISNNPDKGTLSVKLIQVLRDSTLLLYSEELVAYIPRESLLDTVRDFIWLSKPTTLFTVEKYDAEYVLKAIKEDTSTYYLAQGTLRECETMRNRLNVSNLLSTIEMKKEGNTNDK